MRSLQLLIVVLGGVTWANPFMLPNSRKWPRTGGVQSKSFFQARDAKARPSLCRSSFSTSSLVYFVLSSLLFRLCSQKKIMKEWEKKCLVNSQSMRRNCTKVLTRLSKISHDKHSQLSFWANYNLVSFIFYDFVSKSFLILSVVNKIGDFDYKWRVFRLKDYLIVIKNNVKTKMESNMKILELKKKHKKKLKRN